MKKKYSYNLYNNCLSSSDLTQTLAEREIETPLTHEASDNVDTSPHKNIIKRKMTDQCNT